MKIGIAGTGRMGAAMAGRLLSGGFDVTVWNRSREKTQPLAEAGAKVAGSAAALASRCDIVISIVTDAAAIESLYRGDEGLLTGEVGGTLFVDMSTVRPHVEEALAVHVQARGAALIDCPVGGSTGPARDGKLFGFIGGEPADAARARPVLERLCRRLEHVGPVGSGARMKLAINLPLLVYWQALGEALRLIEPLRLDPARVMDILSDTSGGPNILKVRSAALADALAGREVAPITFDIDSIRKDLSTMIEEAHALGSDLPVTERALACYDDAANEGLGARDCTELPARYAHRR